MLSVSWDACDRTNLCLFSLFIRSTISSCLCACSRSLLKSRDMFLLWISSIMAFFLVSSSLYFCWNSSSSCLKSGCLRPELIFLMNLTLYFCRFFCAFSLLTLDSSKRFLAYSERMDASLMMRVRSSSSASFLRSSSNACSIWTCFSFSLNLSIRSLFSVCSRLNTRIFWLMSLDSLKLNAPL